MEVGVGALALVSDNELSDVGFGLDLVCPGEYVGDDGRVLGSGAGVEVAQQAACARVMGGDAGADACRAAALRAAAAAAASVGASYAARSISIAPALCAALTVTPASVSPVAVAASSPSATGNNRVWGSSISDISSDSDIGSGSSLGEDSSSYTDPEFAEYWNF